MAKRVSARFFANSRDVRRAHVGGKQRRSCTHGLPRLNPPRRPNTMVCSNFHILLESNNVTTRRAAPGRAWKSRATTTGRGNLPADIISPPIYHISAHARLGSARLANGVPSSSARSARADRGNNDRMERTMGARAGENAASSRRGNAVAAPTFDSADP